MTKEEEEINESKEYRVWQIGLMLSEINQCYDPECLAMATVQEYVEDAVRQLFDKGWRKDWDCAKEFEE